MPKKHNCIHPCTLIKHATKINNNPGQTEVVPKFRGNLKSTVHIWIVKRNGEQITGLWQMIGEVGHLNKGSTSLLHNQESGHPGLCICN